MSLCNHPGCDIYEHALRAQADGVFLTPTLVQLEPSPIRSIVGTLSQLQPLFLLAGLNEMSP